MHPFQVIMIMSTTALLMVSALFLLIRTMPSRAGIEWWLGASLSLSVSFLLGLLFFDAEKTAIGDAIFYVLQLSAIYGLSFGTLLFFDLKFHHSFRSILFVVTALSVVCLRLFDQQLLSELIFVGYNAFNMINVFIQLVLMKSRDASIKVTAIIFLLIGVHWLDYPFLKGVEWFAPIGFLVGMVLGVSICMMLAVLSLLQFKKQTKESEQKAIYAANHDPLTGLYNRSYLDQLFSEYTTQADEAQRSFAVLYLDLDGFKAVNDTYGHQAGDLLLNIIAKRLTNWLQAKGDTVRVGGDELVVLARLRGTCKTDNVYGLARSILNTIEQPIVDGDQTYDVSASIGICCYPLHGKNLDEMIQRADGLMYSAKQAGGKRIHFADFAKKDEIPVEEKVLETESA